MNSNKVDNVHINLALMRVGVTTVTVAKHYYIFRVCVYSLCYCSIKAYAPYYTRGTQKYPELFFKMIYHFLYYCKPNLLQRTLLVTRYTCTTVEIIPRPLQC
jgi:hypothetical protein